MSNASDPQRSSIAWWALFPLILGLLAPFVLILLASAFAESPQRAVHEKTAVAVLLGLSVEVLALVLGIAGRRRMAGKIAWTGATVLCGVALVGVAVMLRPSAPSTFPPGVEEAIKRQNEAARALGGGKELTLDLDKGVTLKLILIPAGKFTMGSTEAEQWAAAEWHRNHDSLIESAAQVVGNFVKEGPRHEVTISKPFHMGVYEVTQEQYEQIMGKNPSFIYRGANLPVQSVSWFEAVEFCAKLSQKTGRTVRLSTEAEWEYACRAGSDTRYCFGDDANALWWYGWYDDEPHPVGRKKPNGWGLYDVHGNVAEWCADRSPSPYEDGGVTDPTGPETGDLRMVRGGGRLSYTVGCRTAARPSAPAESRNSFVGFRVVVAGVGAALPSTQPARQPSAKPSTRAWQ